MSTGAFSKGKRQRMIFRRVRAPESTVCPVREMALKNIVSPVILFDTNHEIRAGSSEALTIRVRPRSWWCPTGRP